jgi:hypothetical protein
VLAPPIPVPERLLRRLSIAAYSAATSSDDVLRFALRTLADDELALFETLIAEAIATGGAGGSLPPATLGPMPSPARRLLEPLAYVTRGPDDVGARLIVLARLKGTDPETFAEAVAALAEEKARRNAPST